MQYNVDVQCSWELIGRTSSQEYNLTVRAEDTKDAEIEAQAILEDMFELKGMRTPDKIDVLCVYPSGEL